MAEQPTHDPSMQQLPGDEVRRSEPKDVLPIAETLTDPTLPSVAEPTTPVGPLFIIAYAAAYFGAWIAILTPVVVTLALRVQQINPTGKAGSLSLILGVGALFALLANPVFGKLSDRTRSRFGMRRPWLIAGVVAGTIGLLIIAFAPSIPLVLVGWCVAQAGFNALLAVVIAILPDQVPEGQRGVVSGVLGMCQFVAIVVGTFLAQALIGSVFWMFMAPAVVALITVFILVFLLHDRILPRDQRLPPYGIGEFVRSFWVNPLRYPDFGWNWLGRFLFIMGVATLITYQVFYLIDHLHQSPTQVAEQVFVATLVLTVFLVVSSYLGGWLSDKFRRRKIFVMVAAVIYAIGLTVVALVTSFNPFLIAMAICGIGEGMYFGVDLALASAVLPEGGKEAAKDLGVLNIANALPQSLAPAIAPAFLAIGGGGNYTALFIAAALFAFLGALSMQPIKGVR